MNEPTIHFSGNLAAKPKLKPIETADGPVAVTHLRVAVTPRRKGRGEDWLDGETMWFNVTVWRGPAANCAASLDQGDRVVVTGRLTQRTWTDTDGREHPSYEVRADDVALDLSRNPALVLRRTGPPPRQSDPAARWVSTGSVDQETGEVLVIEGATDPSDDELEPEPVAV